MYPRALATALRARGIESFTVAEMGLAGQSDWAVMADAVAEGLWVCQAELAPPRSLDLAPPQWSRLRRSASVR